MRPMIKATSDQTKQGVESWKQNTDPMILKMLTDHGLDIRFFYLPTFNTDISLINKYGFCLYENRNITIPSWIFDAQNSQTGIEKIALHETGHYSVASTEGKQQTNYGLEQMSGTECFIEEILTSFVVRSICSTLLIDTGTKPVYNRDYCEIYDLFKSINSAKKWPNLKLSAEQREPVNKIFNQKMIEWFDKVGITSEGGSKFNYGVLNTTSKESKNDLVSFWSSNVN